MTKVPPVTVVAGTSVVQRVRPMARIRTWFLTGIVVAGPLTVTLVLVLWFVNFVDGAVRKIVPSRFWPDTYLPFPLPGFGVIMAFFGLTLLGFLAANLAGRTAISIGEQLLNRTPVIRSIYRSLKQIFETLFATEGTSLRRVGLVEFPIKGQWSLVFISAPPSAVVDAQLPEEPGGRLSVFLPCSPNPTTGFYFYVPARDVIEVDMTPEEAAKVIMSCGVIQPESPLATPADPAPTQPVPEPLPRAPGGVETPDRVSSFG